MPKSVFKPVLQLLLLLFCAVMFCYQSYNQIETFMTGKSVQTVSRTVSAEERLPVLIFCPSPIILEAGVTREAVMERTVSPIPATRPFPGRINVEKDLRKIYSRLHGNCIRIETDKKVNSLSTVGFCLKKNTSLSLYAISAGTLT